MTVGGGDRTRGRVPSCHRAGVLLLLVAALIAALHVTSPARGLSALAEHPATAAALQEQAASSPPAASRVPSPVDPHPTCAQTPHDEHWCAALPTVNSAQAAAPRESSTPDVVARIPAAPAPARAPAPPAPLASTSRLRI